MWFQITINYHKAENSNSHIFSVIVSEATKDAIITTYMGGTDGKVQYDNVIVRGSPGSPVYGTVIIDWQEDDVFAITIHEAGVPAP